MAASYIHDGSIYENPPLIEVIAEIHWALNELQIAPDAKIDIYYERFAIEVEKIMSMRKFTYSEELIPPAIPIELLPHVPRKRIRQSKNKWPLLQFGPGVITANAVPPYEGWDKFKKFLDFVLEGLYESYPNADQNLRIEKLHLRYIDGFGKRFNFTQFADFAKRMLNIQPPVSKDLFASQLKKGSDFNYDIEARYHNAEPNCSHGRLKVYPGKIAGSNALIMELHCESLYENPEFITLSFATNWFEEAHKSLRDQFHCLVAPELAVMFRREI